MNLFKPSRLLVLILLALAIPLTISLILVQQNTRQKAQTTKIPTTGTATPLELTNDVIKETALYNNASPTKKGTAKKVLIESVKERKESMEKLAEEDPEQFLKVAVSDKIANLVPPEVKKDVELPVKTSGELSVLHVDMEDGSSEFNYFLQSASTRYELHPTKELSEFKSGETVQVTGVRLNNDIVVDSSSKGSIQKKSNVLAASTIGEQKVAVILINFQDDTSQLVSANSALNYTFNTMNSWFREVSYNKAFLSGNVFGYYTLPMSLRATSCDIWMMQSRAFEAAKNDIAFPQFNRFILVLPDTARVCGWSGLSTVGSLSITTSQGTIDASMSWVKGQYYSSSTTIHELGHAFGLWHANAWDCGSVSQAISGCNTVEYGNGFTVMGRGRGHFGAFPKEKLGWLSPSNIQTVSSPSTFNIAPLETVSTGIQAVKIPVRRRVDGSILDYYYLEYRQPIGDDSSLNPDAFNGVVMDWASVPSGGGESQIIDGTPMIGILGSSLPVGNTFHDNVNGINLTTVNKSASSVTVNFSTNTPSCIKSTPTFSTAPASAQGISGARLAYSITITNNNSSACPPAVYTFSTSNLPTGFTSEFSQSSISMTSGTIRSLNLFITSGISAVNGIYTFNTNVFNESISPIATASNSYVVFNSTPIPTPTGIAIPTPTPTRIIAPTPTPTPRPVTTDLQAPTISITSPLNGSAVAINSAVIIKADASDDVGVSYVYFYVDGVSKCFDRTSPYECNWNVGGTPNIRYTISAQAYDASGKSKSTLSDVTARIGIPTPTTLPPTPLLTCDPNKDGVINIIDFEWWKDEYLGVRATKVSDCFKPDGVVDLLDFQIWKDIAVNKVRLPF